ncbi:ribosome-associated translation inhibitor RaiA [Candidatus Saccharibacteria bacterium]|nr:ribosome-associated translation inhibitor RaiA [Candidatus Saccharibacteria bacterium]
MISPIAITGIKYDVDEKTKKYVEQKVGKLERFLPRHARKSASAEVKLTQIDQKNGNKYEAEILLFVPDKVLAAKDSTVNVLAAVDIVEAKLQAQLAKYKEQHSEDRSVLSKFKRSFARESQ